MAKVPPAQTGYRSRVSLLSGCQKLRLRSGYVALYRHEQAADAVYLLTFRHQKEVGY
jgi:hypothetical protein